MSEEDKKSRKARKSALTRESNTLLRFMAEGKREDVESRIITLNGKFDEFEKAHDKYHTTIGDDDAAIDASEDYFFEVEGKYIETLTKLKTWLVAEKKPTISSEETSTDDKDGSQNRAAVMKMLNMPRLELKSFDGDPMNFHAFFAAFDEHVHEAAVDSSVKLARLIQYSSGQALDAIRHCVIVGGRAGYEEARGILKKRFGSNLLISDRIIKSLRDGKPVKTALELQHLADELKNAETVLRSMDLLKEIDTQSSIVTITDRLQSYMRGRWRRLALEYKREHDAYPGFAEFVAFISQEADEANDPVYGSFTVNKASSDSNRGSRSGSTRQADKRQEESSSRSAFATGMSGNRKVIDCILCKQNHRLLGCDKFKALKPCERLQLVRDNKLCENCLLSNHATAECRKPSVCSVPGCGQKHTKFIHVTPVSNVQNHAVNSDDKQRSQIEVHLPLVEVTVNDQLKTCALLDTGSNSTFCTERLVKALKISGKVVQYSLSTLNTSQACKQSELVDLHVTSIDGKNHMHLSNVYVVQEIPVTVPKTNVSAYQHLRDLPLCDGGSQVDVLIGQDHAEALVPLQVRRGDNNDPFATQSLLGWSVNGPVAVGGHVSKQVVSQFVTTSSLETDVRKLWDIEQASLLDETKAWSREDKAVIDLWDEQTRLVDRHYEIPIPWKPCVDFPDNYGVALSRLKSLKSSLVKKGLFEKYHEEMMKLLEKGYAEPVPDNGKCGDKIWYLPHQLVLNDKKPGKIRIVFDCASKFQGESLNDKSYQGPDLVNKLLFVLLRFRQHDSAIMADIEAMYNQVRIPSRDRDALRFLWYDSDGNIIQYRMTSHLFGGVWCACSSTYALRRIVQDNDNIDDMIADVIYNSFYVDDCLHSVPSPEEAENVVFSTQQALQKGGFKLTKFVSSDKETLLKIPVTDRAKEVQNLDEKSHSRALGVWWDSDDDIFYYKADVVVCEPMSKRKMLSTVSSMFDPLGLVSPIIVVGRMLFQKATRLSDLSWDDPVPVELQQLWGTWIDSLQHLPVLKFPRCVKPAAFDDCVVELHHFSDASSQAYGSCSYVRCVNKQGQIKTALIMGKSRVAPLKAVTIPRLELQAAVLSAQADSLLRGQLSIHITKSWFWTDSEIVLRYLKNDSRRFHVFVGNRVGVISSLTDPADWYHVEGKNNPADLLTRGQDVKSFDHELWSQGPTFLNTYKSDWSLTSVDVSLTDGDPEVKSILRTCVTDVREHPLDVMIGHYSSWFRLKKAVGWLLKVLDWFKGRIKGDDMAHDVTLSFQDVHKAEVVLIQHVQTIVYAEDIEMLQSGKVRKSSQIRDLSPYINVEGVVCVGGRVKHSTFSEGRKHPYIIPHRHVLASLIAREIHEIAHLGTEWSLSLLRAKYWITRARSVLRKVRSQCVTCRKMYDPPLVQQMSDLPAERLEEGKPPFSFVGLDCFGPYSVKVGRSHVKRYGCIFTCFTTRAVHLEKIDSMDTDSFLNAFRRFVGRRGLPLKVFSDNGTNFVGAKAELDRNIRSMDQGKIQAFAVKLGFEWIFNPPHAPHMGGVWERLVGVVKRVFTAILGNARLTDEILETLLVEAESIVNSRPITRSSDQVTDPSPLTPNHLLLLRYGPPPAPGVFDLHDVYRRRWRHVQSLANQFWGRWLREYVPELQRRSKWHDRSKNVEVGDVVLVLDESTPRSVWPLGIVTQVNFGKDGLVRSVSIKTRSTVLVRPIHKIVWLEGHV